MDSKRNIWFRRYEFGAEVVRIGATTFSTVFVFLFINFIPSTVAGVPELEEFEFAHVTGAHV